MMNRIDAVQVSDTTEAKLIFCRWQPKNSPAMDWQVES